MKWCVLLFVSIGAFGKSARTIHLSDTRTESVFIAPEQSVILSFPTHPSKVILGNKGSFAIQYVESDLAISALKYPAHSNLFVYLDGRRFGFDLKTVATGGDEIVLVRDSAEQKIRVKIKDD